MSWDTSAPSGGGGGEWGSGPTTTFNEPTNGGVNSFGGAFNGDAFGGGGAFEDAAGGGGGGPSGGCFNCGEEGYVHLLALLDNMLTIYQSHAWRLSKPCEAPCLLQLWSRGVSFQWAILHPLLNP